MTKKTISNKPILFLGDIHGDWNSLLSIIKSKKISDVNIISVGDLGIGFNPSIDLMNCDLINKQLQQKNINFYGIAGNHDDRSYFKGENRVCLDNFELIEDYSVFECNDKTIQFVGGAISIDRIARVVGISYWKDEVVVFDKDKCQKVDILVTHTAPSYCFPQKFSQIVYDWAREDRDLLKELKEERKEMDEIFKLCNPSLHLYGHFHSSWTEEINGCKHRLLDINELWEYRD